MSRLTYNGKQISLGGMTFIIPNQSPPTPTPIEYNLRDIGPAGGFIFYINPNYQTDGWHYLEAAPSDEDTYTTRWSNVNSELLGTTETTIGSGLSNTEEITNISTSGAAFVCNSFEINSYDDWFLGSQDEVNMMYTELHLYSVGNFALSSYWTSSEASATNAYRQTFNGGTQSSASKSTYYRLRPIRRFSDVSKYSLIYDGNGFTDGLLPSNIIQVIQGTEIIVDSPVNLSKNSVNFVSWNTNANGNGINYSTGATFRISENITLYAQWEFITLAFLPDTQSYVKWKNTPFIDQIDWLIANKDNLKLKFVGHEGDIVQSYDTDITEWEFAMGQMERLYDNGIPFSTLPGNHDYSDGTRDSTMYNTYCPLTYFEQMSTYMGAYEENKSDNTYHKVNINGVDLLILSLEFGPRDGVIEWANTILENNSTTKALILVHSYLKYNGELLASVDNHAPSNGYGLGTDVNDGTDLWTKLVYPNNNVRFVICGHDGLSDDGSGLRISIHEDGSNIYQVMSNYQYYPDYPGYLLLLEFSGENIRLRTYSPYLDEYKTDSESQEDWTW